MDKKKVALVVGARPNYVKAKPILARLDRIGFIETSLVHTGQHFDTELYEFLFNQLDLRKADVFLGHEDRNQRFGVPDMISRFADYCVGHRPDAVIVLGDVDSTAAAALAAAYHRIPVIHVEAGLRSFDRHMPEEINRVVTDALSRLLLVSDPAGVDNLRREGRRPDEIKLVGNVMIDTLLDRLEAALDEPLPPRVQEVVDGGDYALLTMHRPSNVDGAGMLSAWAGALKQISAEIPVIFPMHPRTQRSLLNHDLLQEYATIPHMVIVRPLGYLEIIKVEKGARFIMTDSAGISEEASVLDVPCLTMRTTTERPITLTDGTNVLVRDDPRLLLEYAEAILAGEHRPHGRIALWDGRAGERVAEEVCRFLTGGGG